MMPQNSSDEIDPSRSPPRISPSDSRYPSTRTSACPLPLPPAHPSGHDAGRSGSDNSLSPASAYCHSLYPATNTAGYPSVPPFLSSQPTYAMQPSTSTHQLQYSTYQTHSFPQPPAHLAQLPAFPQSPLYPPSPTNISPLPNSSPLHASQLPITIHRREDPTYQNYSVHQQLLQSRQGQASTRTQQGKTYYGKGMFKNSHNFAVTNSTFIDNSTITDNFMREFLQHTIIGAEFDSSDRHPPPRCHPGTRLAIIERCKIFVVQCNGKEKMRWVVGPAGVGKSAIMQIVAEETLAAASVFLSVNGRQDGSKTITTIAYQLAVKYQPYRQFIQNEISHDPSLLHKALPAQFQKFIVDPFIHQHLFDPSRRFLIIIDGLNECDNPLTQRELLGLISDFCISYPSSSVVWIVASRPEPHITSFFDDPRVAPAYTQEEIMIDSDEASEDVQGYLRDELKEIKLTYPSLRHKREWPSELEFTKIATAAGGLFAYASTVVRCISDPHYRGPVAQLRRVLEAIDAGLKDDVSGRGHPMAQLDALYQRILSNIPADVMVNTRKLLLMYSEYGWYGDLLGFRLQCNEIGLTEDVAYGAVCHLHAVLKVPAPDEADEEGLEYFHKSFQDFLLDFERSGLSHDVEDEADQFLAQCLLRIVKQVPDNFEGMAGGEVIECVGDGYLKSGPGLCDNVSLSWPGDERYQITDEQLRLRLYRNSMLEMCYKYRVSDEFYGSMACFHILTTRFTAPGSGFPIYELRDSAFEQFRPELTKLGKLKQVPLRRLDYAAICGRIDLRFASPIGMDVKHSDPWNMSCEHGKSAEEDLDALQQWRGWTTSFQIFLSNPGGDVTHTDILPFGIKAGKHSYREPIYDPGVRECLYCSRRFARHLNDNLDQLATVFVDSTEMCYVELSFVDPDDGVSEWRYRFCHSGPPSCFN